MFAHRVQCLSGSRFLEQVEVESNPGIQSINIYIQPALDPLDMELFEPVSKGRRGLGTVDYYKHIVE